MRNILVVEFLRENFFPVCNRPFGPPWPWRSSPEFPLHFDAESPCSRWPLCPVWPVLVKSKFLRTHGNPNIIHDLSICITAPEILVEGGLLLELGNVLRGSIIHRRILKTTTRHRINHFKSKPDPIRRNFSRNIHAPARDSHLDALATKPRPGAPVTAKPPAAHKYAFAVTSGEPEARRHAGPAMLWLEELEGNFG
jgi:hypothetical protein